MLIDTALFDPGAVDAETAALNADILRRLAGLPDQWSVPPAVVRDRRRQGLGPFPLAPKSERARIVTIEGSRGAIELRIVAPDTPRGAYLHIHGGGWVLGGADLQDDRLEWLATRCGLAAVSVEYRLAPEAPYPAGPDDCEAAALWLAQHASREFGTDRLAIGGESAGAHLSVVTLLRLRDRHGIMPFRAANLEAGCYDLGQTPSVRRWGEEKLILNTRDIFMFVQNYLRTTGDVRDPDVSPIHADLAGLPPALFSVGTRDPLLDDSLFMATRWMAAGNRAELAVWPGGAHVFTAFPCALTDQALARMEAFLGTALA
jgi:acetyl esterase/lipase